jgi:putative phosphoribosyl transferase
VSGMTPLSSLVRIDVGPLTLEGDLNVPEGARGLVLFAHGSGSSRLSPRNRQVAGILNERGLGTVLFDLLTDAEAANRRLVFDVELLAARLAAATDWAREEPELKALPRGYFGASTGAAAALIAAADRPDDVRAVVSRGGRPDLAAARLPEVRAPTLLIVGGADVEVLRLNRWALELLQAPAELAVVPGATHLFEEPGALEQVADLSARWFSDHLSTSHSVT